MAIAQQSLTQGDTGASTPTTLTTSVTISAGATLLLVVRVHIEAAASTITSVVWNGNALSLLGVAAGGTWTRTAIYILKNPTPATGDLVTTISAGSHMKHSAEVLTGVDQTTTNRTTQTGAADTGTSTTKTVPSVASGDYVVSALTLDATGHAHAPGADETEDYDAAFGAAASEAISTHQAGANGGVMSGTWTTSCPNSQVATAFIPDGGGGAASDSTRIVVANVVPVRFYNSWF